MAFDACSSAIAEQLTTGIQKKITQQVSLIKDVEKQVENITSNLKAIQAHLEDAEERQVKEAVVRDWLDKLKEVWYEIDDVLDEWNTKLLKQQIEKEENEGENSPDRRNKVCLTISSYCFCFGKVGRIFTRRSIALKIKDLSERLTEISNERQLFNFQSIEKAIEHERSKSSSLVDISKIFGRENEKDILVSKLLSESSEEMGPRVIPIVGMGGMGKTALAQLGYNDEKVQFHFEKRLWVCVSDPFDKIKIAKAIIECLCKNDSRISSNELQTLFECIEQAIEGKKFLLVLDDVWTQDYSKWEPLKLSLKKGAVGSRIVITTRKEEVATMVSESSDHMIQLKELSEQSCLSLFNHMAFLDREREDAFEAIGKQIVSKCKGLPLAAKTLGSLMRYKKTRKEWLDVLESKVWELEEVEQQVFQPFLLSYYDLTSPMRRCLLHCAIFPKDYEFDKNDLIEMWMSQDYLYSKGNREKDVIGEIYFNNLVMRSFFQDFGKDDDGNITSCKMHDIVHDFVQFLTKTECLIVEADTASKKNKVLGDKKVRHLGLMSAPDGAIPPSINSCKKLRTLIASHLEIKTLNSDLVLRLKRLRALNLRGNDIQIFPKELGVLVHLRYLDFSGSGMKELPESLGSLYNLQTLRLVSCSVLERLPQTMGRLSHLRHLYIRWCSRLKLPKGVGRLTGLRRLDELINVYDDSDTSTSTSTTTNNNDVFFKLGDLGNLDSLQERLDIRNLRRVKDASEAKKARLANKKHLQCLNLDFGLDRGQPEKHRKMDEEVLSALQPHANLERLSISDYHGATGYLKWTTSLQGLRRLVLVRCNFCEFFPALGKLPSLEFLEMSWMGRVKKVGVEFLGIDPKSEMQQKSLNSFPKLKQLNFEYIKDWEKWEGVGEGKKEDRGSEIMIMPSLSSLHIHECNKLKALPDFLWKTPLQTLSVDRCSTLLGGKGFRKKKGKAWDKMAHIPNIKISGAFVQKGGVHQTQPEKQQNHPTAEFGKWWS